MAAASDVVRNISVTIEFLSVADRSADPSTLTLLSLGGANSASDDSGIQTVDISTFGDIRVPKAKVAYDSNYTVSGLIVPGAAQTAFRSLADGADKDKECYMLITNGDGSTEGFYATITAYSQERVLRDVMKFTSTVNVQSEPVYTAAP